MRNNTLSFADLPSHAGAAGRRAVVIGASMAGLLTARVLSEHFDEVWLLDRDGLPAGDEHRKATPHSRHAHGLLARGREVMESLLPGITDEWVARGARLGDLQGEVAFYGGRHRFVQQPAGLLALAGSRPLLEAAVRRRVLALPRVRACTGVDVRGLAAHGTQVTGVRLTALEGERELQFEAALVVDASGRASRMPAWLRELGFEPPAEERVQVDLRYATCHFQRQPQHAPGLEVVLCATGPGVSKSGVMLAQEGDRWVVTLAGYGADAPPLTLQAFIERTRHMPAGEITATVTDAVPLHDPIGYRFPHSQRRRYESLRRFPQGLLVIGDAICSFNPIYGQGMSVAACEALALGQALQRGEAKLAQRFFRQAARIVDTPWSTAVGADLALDAVPGPRPRAVRLVNAYIARVFQAARHDPVVAAAFLKVAHLLAEPPSLMKPAMLWRVWRTLRRVRDERSEEPYSVRLRTR
jgi:2-polyprenyl-6-methoxyphenol hydroxylase-like FAD-dependent oxidoreductase